MTQKKVVNTDRAPKAIGPYSVAVQAGKLIFTAGQLGIDPQTNDLIPGGVEAETRQALTNLKNILEAAGGSIDTVIKTTVFLRDIKEFAIMNRVYGTFFNGNPPARSTVQVAALPKNGAVEIEAVALAVE